ncbi:unnamed protein product [Bursaphelenchus okinawaensis]|uniref:Uncharacterized protein n=1 Tax=Bursaphelenchus okinawaensis TaxID=465554 RepID=A0A811KW70_9BILA|nr:unnamed protein product [Bursaphelenchus okinawaensis]CAG9114285.1 unnamed protein product [Bursaphelenchus okinawaensis]
MCSRVVLFSLVLVCIIAFVYSDCGCGCDCDCGSNCPDGLILNSTRRRRANKHNIQLTELPRISRQTAEEKLAQIEGQTVERDRTPQVSLIKAVNPMGLRRKPAAPSSTTPATISSTSA